MHKDNFTGNGPGMGQMRRTNWSENLRWKYPLGKGKHKRDDDMEIILKEITVPNMMNFNIW
jgi:hypothetical protein